MQHDQIHLTERQKQAWRILNEELRKQPNTLAGQAMALRQFAVCVLKASGLSIAVKGSTLKQFKTSHEKTTALRSMSLRGTWLEDWVMLPALDALGYGVILEVRNNQQKLVYEVSENTGNGLQPVHVVNHDNVHWERRISKTRVQTNPGRGDCGAYVLTQAVHDDLPAIQKLLTPAVKTTTAVTAKHVAVAAQPVSVAVTAKPVAVTVAAQPVAVAVTAKPVAVAVTAKPVAVTVTTKPVAVTVAAQPVAVAVTVKPVAVAVTTKPVAVAIAAQPVPKAQAVVSTAVALKTPATSPASNPNKKSTTETRHLKNAKDASLINERQKQAILPAVSNLLAPNATAALIEIYLTAMQPPYNRDNDIWLSSYAQNAGNEILADALVGLPWDPSQESALREKLLHGLATEAWRNPAGAEMLHADYVKNMQLQMQAQSAQKMQTQSAQTHPFATGAQSSLFAKATTSCAAEVENAAGHANAPGLLVR